VKGSRFIRLKTPRVSFEIILERKITVLKGLSATGKSTFVNTIEQRLTRGINSSRINLSSNAKLCVLREISNWKELLLKEKETIFISDEGNTYVDTVEFAEYVKKSDNYFLLITRSGMLHCLTYSVDSILEFKSEKKDSITVTKAYNMYFEETPKSKPSVLITEDSGTGNEMMSLLAKGFPVKSSNGKDNMIKSFMSYNGEKGIYLLVDRAAFGSNIGSFDMLLPSVNIVAPESFEWLLLKTRLLYRFVRDEVDNTVDHCEFSEDVLTYENYYYNLLRRILKEKCHVSYNKSKLVDILKSAEVLEDVKKLLSQIDFD
jgi:hypothetical protein